MSPFTHAILLSGSPRGDDVGSRCGVSMLDLPVDGTGRSLLDAWIDELARALPGADRASIAICSPKASPPPGRFRPLGPGVRFEPDRDDVRGTGGATLDALEAASNDHWALIAEASRLPVPDLSQFVLSCSKEAPDASVLMGVHADRSLAGVVLARVGTLRSGRRAQFSDLKEQILPQLIASGEEVRAVALSRASRAIRTREGYLGALRGMNGWAEIAADGVRARVIERGVQDSIVCEGARIAPGATIRASVVLPGATIGADSVVVSCVLGPSANVKPSEKLFERQA